MADNPEEIAAETEQNESSSMRYVIFELGKEIFGLTLDSVKEVLEIPQIRKVPRTSNRFAGVFNLRGEVLPIINFAKCLFQETDSGPNTTALKSQKVIVVKAYRELVGIIVDNIYDIVELTEDNFDEIPTAIETKVSANIIEKIAHYQDKIIKVLDIKDILSEKLLFANEPSEPVEIVHQPELVKKAIELKEKPKAKAKEIEKSSFKLTKGQIDALKEISNIASGKASIALADLFKGQNKISISVDQAVLKSLKEIHKQATIDLSTPVISLRAFIKKDLDATLFFIIPLDSLATILEQMEESTPLPESIISLDDLDEGIKSAIKEFGNIIISHYCSGISDFLKIQVYHEVPELALDMYGAVLDSDIAQLAEHTDQVLTLRTSIQVKSKVITAEVILFPAYDSMAKFVNWLDEDKIVALLEAEAAGSTPLELEQEQLQAKPAKKSSAKKEKATSTKAAAKETPKTSTKKATVSDKDSFGNVQFQSEFEINQEDKQELQIGDDDLDVFRELGNIGAGNAGNALSQMLNKKVFLDIPPAKVMPLSDLIKSYTSKNQFLVGYFGATSGLFETNLLLLFNTDHIESLLQIITEADTKKVLKTETDLNTTEKSAVEELLNILMGHYIAAMSNFLKTQIEPPQYQFFFKKSKQLFSSLQLGGDDKETKAIVIETSLQVSEGPTLRGQFILLVDPSVFKKILDRIHEIW